MVKKLRYKFVAVTMTLMVTVFGIFFLADYLYNRYWNDLDILDTLEWFADAGVFRNETMVGDTDMDLDETNGYSVYFVLLDRSGKVVKTAGTSEKSIPEQVWKTLSNNPPEVWKWRSYIYTVRNYEDGQKGIYLTNTAERSVSFKKILGTVSLVCAGFLLLLGVSFYLSNYVVEPARKALEREKQFISDASHELKTPVAAISVNAQALMGQMEENRHLKYILSESERMDRLIRRLLTLAVMEGGGKNSPKERFSLSDCCEEAALTMESMAYEKKIRFTYKIERPVSFYGNEDEIRQLVAILLDNAMKHTFEQGEIQFHLKRKNNYILFWVQNSGQGIKEDDMTHIFERFYSTEKSRSGKKDSFGLGLSIAKAIVEDHGGKISVKSEYGSYACFTVCFGGVGGKIHSSA